jgi:hypothetical protein
MNEWCYACNSSVSLKRQGGKFLPSVANRGRYAAKAAVAIFTIPFYNITGVGVGFATIKIRTLYLPAQAT